MPKMIVTGGGTAGHINPAIAIAKKMESLGFETLYIGSDEPESMDREIVTRAGLRFQGLKLVTPILKLSLLTIRSVLSILKSVFVGIGIIRREKPDIIVGTGGFVSMAMLLAGWLSKVPVAVQEQNVLMGITNRFVSRFCKRIFLTFSESEVYLKKKAKERAVVTGLPLLHLPKRVSVEAYEKRIQSGVRMLVVGGSLGAGFFNNIISEIAPQLAAIQGLQIKLACGQSYFETTKIEGVEVVPYITQMTDELEQTDLIMCRAGSSTVFEVIKAGVPAIVIPSPNVVSDHQRPNAEYLASTGGADFFEEKDLQGYLLLKHISELCANRELLVEKKRALNQIDSPDALELIAKELQEICKQRKK